MLQATRTTRTCYANRPTSLGDDLDKEGPVRFPMLRLLLEMHYNSWLRRVTKRYLGLTYNCKYFKLRRLTFSRDVVVVGAILVGAGLVQGELAQAVGWYMHGACWCSLACNCLVINTCTRGAMAETRWIQQIRDPGSAWFTLGLPLSVVAERQLCMHALELTCSHLDLVSRSPLPSHHYMTVTAE